MTHLSRYGAGVMLEWRDNEAIVSVRDGRPYVWWCVWYRGRWREYRGRPLAVLARMLGLPLTAGLAHRRLSGDTWARWARRFGR